MTTGRTPIRAAPLRASRLLAVCGKCGRKLAGGFGDKGKASLVKTLRRDLAGAKGKRAGVLVVETKCLDICPKHAVAMVDSARLGEVLIVPEGTNSAELAERLGLPLA